MDTPSVRRLFYTRKYRRPRKITKTVQPASVSMDFTSLFRNAAIPCGKRTPEDAFHMDGVACIHGIFLPPQGEYGAPAASGASKTPRTLFKSGGAVFKRLGRRSYFLTGMISSSATAA